MLLHRFEREARATAALRSPHTVALYDYGTADDGSFYYAMEFLDGVDLETLVRQFGPVPAGRAIWLLTQAARSLAEAHSLGLVHRDIKPRNLFACRLGTEFDFVKVLDFGLVKVRERETTQTCLTSEGVTTGTPAYMAPEVAMGRQDIDGRADLYSLGCVAYWLVTGQLVFEADNAMAMVLAHIQTGPEPPSRRTEIDIPGPLEELILQCLAKDPAGRPQSARRMIERLAACEDGEPWTQKHAEQWWGTHLPEKIPGARTGRRRRRTDNVSGRPETDRAATLAMLGAAVMIAYQVAGKATRPALFLDYFSPDSLAGLHAAAALFAILLGIVAARGMAAAGPSQLVPPAFAASGLLHIVEWVLCPHLPRAVAAAFYLHYAGFGLTLISGFWSLLSECFDPHTARKQIARITAGASVGALAGGGMTFLVSNPRAMLPLLAVMQLGCAAMLRGMHGPAADPGSPKTGDEGGWRSGARLIRAHPYLRNLALLIFLGAAGATIIDLALVTRAAGEGDPLKFFGLIFTAAGIANCAIQAAATRSLLDKAGLGVTAGAHPVTIMLGSLGAAAGGIGSLAVARISEQVVRNSLFRSAYELFYTPLPPAEKRAAKPLIDVGAERIGDLAGTAAVGLIQPHPLLLGVAAAAGLAGLWITRRLDREYVTALERSLRTRAVDLKLEEVADHTTRATLVRTMAQPEAVPAPGPLTRRHSVVDLKDPVVARIAELRSGDRGRARRALSESVVTPAVAAHAIALLGWDELAGDAIRALRDAGPGITGQLADALADDATEFAIRRRIPRVLGSFRGRRALDALVLGLNDKRFEVRYRCGRGVAAVLEKEPGFALPRDLVYGAVSKELEVDKRLWESRRLLDGAEEDQLVGDRANRGLEHVFTLLSLVLPTKPLQIAFYALHTEDAMLRGTALEYLDSILPLRIRERLRVLLNEIGRESCAPHTDGESLSLLLQSHESIHAKLLELRARAGAGVGRLTASAAAENES